MRLDQHQLVLSKKFSAKGELKYTIQVTIFVEKEIRIELSFKVRSSTRTNSLGKSSWEILFTARKSYLQHL